MENPGVPSLELESGVLPAEPAAPQWRGASFAVDARRFGSAVGVATVLSIGQFLLLPRLLDVATYGAFRVFAVYGIYAGVLHLGLPDGAYVRWAGRDRAEVLREWRMSAAWLSLVQAGFLAIALVVASMLEDGRVAATVAALGAFAFAANLLTLATCAFQATGEFRRAGALAVIPPAALLLGVVLAPGSARTLPGVLAIAVAAQAIPALLASWWLRTAESRVGRVPGDLPVDGATHSLRHSPGAVDADASVTLSGLLRLGVPVLAANVIAGLALSADRLLLSVSIPVEAFAMYGFAASAFVIANAVTQGLARVSVPHAARLPEASRGAFYGKLYGVIAAGFGAGLALYPAVEAVVAGFLPAYTGALPIMRALLPGALFGVALHVVVFATLLVRQAVRTQLAIAVAAAVLVLLATGAAITLDAPLWGVAAASSAALGAGWATGVVASAHQSPIERPTGMGVFVLCVVAQLASLAVALGTSDALVPRTAIYVALAAVPTIIAWRRAS